MKIIDSHLHFRPELPHYNELANRAAHENSDVHLREEYEKYQIKAGIVMGNSGLDGEEYQYPPFLKYCIGLDGRYLKEHRISESCDMVEFHLKRKDCVGVKLYPGYSPIYVSDASYEPVYELAKQYAKPVAVHTGQTAGSRAYLKYSHPLTLDEAAVAHPDVQFVMCHFGNPFLADAAAVVEKNENVTADLSGLLVGKLDLERYFSEQSGYLEALRTWIAYPDDFSKFMFGTDWPLANYGDTIEVTKKVVPERYWDDVFFQNANRIYKLGLE